MKEITKFQAVDGKEFKDAEKCLEYEGIISEVEKVMATLPPKLKMKGCGFENGYGFVQHNRADFFKVKIELLKIAGRFIKHEWIEQTSNDETVHLSYAARLISEYGMLDPLYNAWIRLQCTDKQFREWGQPYFAEHPEEAPYFKKYSCLT